MNTSIRQLSVSLFLLFSLALYMPQTSLAYTHIVYRNTAQAEQPAYGFKVNADGWVQLEGVPYPGSYWYHTGRRQLYVYWEQNWWRMGFSELRREVIQGDVQAIDGEEFINNWATRRWQVRVLGRECSRLSASRSAGMASGLDAADIALINSALGYIFNGENKRNCQYYLLPGAAGRMIGLPLAADGFRAEITQNDKKLAGMPDAALAQPFTQAVKLALLKAHHGAQAQALEHLHAPDGVKLKTLQQMPLEQ